MTPGRAALFVFIAFSALCARFIPGIDASGDEVHYLVMAQSLWREHDLDLRDNYAREDWREFRSGATTPHYAAPRLDGRPFPAHSPGLPFVLAPIYALGGRLACAVFLSALLAALFYLVASFVETNMARSTGLIAGLVAIGAPTAAYALHIYTELPSALVLFTAYRVLVTPRPARAYGAALLALCAVALPWLHPKMALASVVLAWGAWRKRSDLSFPTFATIAALGALHYAWFWAGIFGVPASIGAYGGVPDDASGFPGQALFGLLLDRAYGLFPIAPIFALALVLLVAKAGSARPRLEEALICLAVLIPILPWRMWWGGQCPPARFLVPIMPFVAAWTARAAGTLWQGKMKVVAVLSILWSWGLFLFSALQPGLLLFINKRTRPTRIWDALWPGGPLDALLPDLARPEPSDWLRTGAWLGAFLLAALWARRSYRVR